MTSSWDHINQPEPEPLPLLVQKWEETERGWGTRPDGYTLHRAPDDIDAFLKEMRAREMEGKPEGHVPNEYSRPCGTPYWTVITDRELFDRVAASDNGLWGPDGNTYPKAYVQGEGKDGWVNMPPRPPANQPKTAIERVAEDDDV